MATSVARLTVPGPKPMKVFGPAGNLLFGEKTCFSLIAGEMFKKYGPVFSLVEGGGTRVYSPYPTCPGTVITNGAEITRQIATQDEAFHKSPLSCTLYPLGDVPPRKAPLKRFGYGLFGVNEEEHRRQRRMLMPAFHRQQIRAYHDTMLRITQATLERWQPGQVISVNREMQNLTMDIVTALLFGEEDSVKDTGIGQALQETLSLVTDVRVRLMPFDLPGFRYRRLLAAANHVDAVINGIIAHKRAAGAQGQDLMSALIRARDAEDGSALTEEELISHAGVLFVAGHETSANALSWTLFLLAQHPSVAADLDDELRSQLHGQPPTIDQLNGLRLLDGVIKESMRLFPPAPLNGRVLSREVEVGGYTLPAGTEILHSIYWTQRAPQVFDQPDCFDPYRWERIAPTVFEYNPFSAGPRMCIGAGFAIQEIKVVLATLLQRFRLEPTPGMMVTPKETIVLSTVEGLPMIIRGSDRRFGEGTGGTLGLVRQMVRLPE
jgi:cytochrome P450